MGMVDKQQIKESGAHDAWTGIGFGGPAGQGIQGLTELVECERTRDRWLQTLQQEIRNGALSANKPCIFARMANGGARQLEWPRGFRV